MRTVGINLKVDQFNSLFSSLPKAIKRIAQYKLYGLFIERLTVLATLRTFTEILRINRVF
jgi:hypothetical protein